MLSGKPPYGGHILSHDYVEAAMLAREGWKVEVDPTLTGSYEEGPENLIEYAVIRYGGYFKANPAEFHRADGAGYAFWAEQVIALDRNNPQVASRMARALEGWRKFTPEIQARIRPALEKVAATEGISPDVAEIVGKALG